MLGESKAVPGVGGNVRTFAAIEAVYRARFAEFVRVAAAICGDVDAGADAVQEAFSSALRAAGDYRGDGSLEGWLWRSVVNTARNHRRGALRRVRRHPFSAGEPQSAPRTDGDPAVRRLVAALPERQRLVVFLRYFGGLEYAEIATALTIAPGTVGATLSQAHAALRVAIEKQEAD